MSSKCETLCLTNILHDLLVERTFQIHAKVQSILHLPKLHTWSSTLAQNKISPSSINCTFYDFTFSKKKQVKEPGNHIFAHKTWVCLTGMFSFYKHNLGPTLDQMDPKAWNCTFISFQNSCCSFHDALRCFVRLYTFRLDRTVPSRQITYKTICQRGSMKKKRQKQNRVWERERGPVGEFLWYFASDLACSQIDSAK